jgi:hypothetical protein
MFRPSYDSTLPHDTPTVSILPELAGPRRSRWGVRGSCPAQLRGNGSPGVRRPLGPIDVPSPSLKSCSASMASPFVSTPYHDAPTVSILPELAGPGAGHWGVRGSRAWSFLVRHSINFFSQGPRHPDDHPPGFPASAASNKIQIEAAAWARWGNPDSGSRSSTFAPQRHVPQDGSMVCRGVHFGLAPVPEAVTLCAVTQGFGDGTQCGCGEQMQGCLFGSCFALQGRWGVWCSWFRVCFE